jgi:putative transposase
VYRILKCQGWLSSSRDKTPRAGRLHKGRVAVPVPDTRWASDISDIKTWDGQKARLAVMVDCGDRMVLAWRCLPHITGEDLCEMLREALYRRFGTDLRQAQGIEFLSDNGTEYTSWAFRDFLKARGMVACRTPVRSPQSNGVMEAFFSWFKRDYVIQHPIETLEALQQQVPGWVKHYNETAPHSALGMKSPARFYEEWLSKNRVKNKRIPVHN